jgi:hypothetical protein
LENLAKDCKIRLYIKGSYYQLPDPSQQVLISDADLVIGHGFQFEIRDEDNTMLCNKICLGKSIKIIISILLINIVSRSRSSGYS